MLQAPTTMREGSRRRGESSRRWCKSYGDGAGLTTMVQWLMMLLQESTTIR
jgi:hypothetical protein